MRKMTKRICITVPDNIAKKLELYMNTYPTDKKKNVSSFISSLIDYHTPIVNID